MALSFSWLGGGNDRQLAADKYSGTESASDKAVRREAARSARRRERHHRSGARDADRAGWKWADAERRRQDGRG
ncbi:hypothetical protein OG742_12320 [Streptomyces sp. NBC_00828]|uniref:hypothetical protein n=1 Tax=Streptomyces sp. NBC_00828 TaxID=2903678 RepID=UPI00386C8CED